jgi:hypothetical protein
MGWDDIFFAFQRRTETENDFRVIIYTSETHTHTLRKYT